MNETDVAYTTLTPGPKGFVSDHEGGYHRALQRDAQFAPEDDCEDDPDCYELVVYTVVWRERDGRPEVLVGQRQPDAGEGRLHGKLTIGWGGNAERRDAKPLSCCLLKQAVRRELHEELDVEFTERGRLRIDYHGLLNDPSNDVGRDHLGLVYSVQVADAKVRETDKYGEGEWWTYDALRATRAKATPSLESWSSLLLPHLGDMIGGDQ